MREVQCHPRHDAMQQPSWRCGDALEMPLNVGRLLAAACAAAGLRPAPSHASSSAPPACAAAAVTPCREPCGEAASGPGRPAAATLTAPVLAAPSSLLCSISSEARKAAEVW